MERNVPRDQWLYDDRCMEKWQGWILADHSAFLESEDKRLQPKRPKPEMTKDEINQVLEQAYVKSQVVEVQENTEYNGQYENCISGAIVGFSMGQLYLQRNTGKIMTIIVDDLRNAEMIDAEKWWKQQTY